MQVCNGELPRWYWPYSTHGCDERISLMSTYTFGWYEDYFLATGAWDHVNFSENLIRSSDLECFRDQGICVETDAQEAKILGLATLTSARTEFKITKWDQFELIAENVSPDCERDELRINQQEKTVSLISTPTYKVDSCKNLLGKPETVTYRLVDGVKIWSERTQENSKRKSSLYQLLPKARAILDAKD
jgi:hypothetical protein